MLETQAKALRTLLDNTDPRKVAVNL